MKTIKSIFFTLIAFTIVSSIGGYIYFDKKFTPPENYLELSGTSDTIPIKWVENELSPIAAILLPVRLEGISHQFYMQFDLGSHSTIFYKDPLASIFDRFPEHFNVTDSTLNTTEQSFNLGKIEVYSAKFRVLDHGKPIDWAQGAVNIIGTLGADFIEKKITVIDFKKGLCYFGESMPDINLQDDLNDFEFKKRKVLLPAKIDDKDYDLLYDTGSSAYELITTQELWKRFSAENAEVRTSRANSQGRPLKTHTVETNKILEFGSSKISLKEVTYVEGYSSVQYLMMKLSGMGGMIGNKIFMNNSLILDCKNQKFGILE